MSVRVEPQLQALSGKSFSEKSANKLDRARLTGQVAFFDVRVFNATAKRYVNQKLCKSYEVDEKNKQYN